MFFIERSNGAAWDIMCASAEYMPLSEIQGPRNHYPTNPNYPAFAGKDGQEARIRYRDENGDTVIERYRWGKVAYNPADPEPFMIPGWALIEKRPPPASASRFIFSMMGAGVPATSIDVGTPAPKRE